MRCCNRYRPAVLIKSQNNFATIAGLQPQPEGFAKCIYAVLADKAEFDLIGEPLNALHRLRGIRFCVADDRKHGIDLGHFSGVKASRGSVCLRKAGRGKRRTALNYGQSKD